MTKIATNSPAAPKAWTKPPTSWSITSINAWLLLGCWVVVGSLPLMAQKRLKSYLSGTYETFLLKSEGLTFQAFSFDLEAQSVRVAYFGQQGGVRYERWRRQQRPRVLCYLAVGFAQDWAPEEPPLGLSVEGGDILNRTLHAEMDGLLYVDGRGRLQGLDVGHEAYAGRYDLRQSRDRSAFLRVATRQDLSICQTQLMYSTSGGKSMGDPTYGKRASRRLLALCQDQQGHQRAIILDLVKATHLNRAAAAALSALQDAGYRVSYLFNQDTGSRDIMAAFDGAGNRLYTAPVSVQKATQLLVFYN